MPSCRVVNKTGTPLNVCLKQVAALHFENAVKPDQEVKFKPGRVWFTLEVQVDDGSSNTRYSVLKSAATIGLLSLAVGAVAASAGAALLPASATAGVVAGAATAGSYLSKAGWVARAALVKNAGTIGKISSIAVPKAVEKISSEVGGLTALQKEVLSIVASPTLSSDVRNKATHLLKSLYGAYTTDKTDPNRPSATIVPIVENSQRSSGQAQEAEILATQLNTTDAASYIESVPVQSGTILRVHGIYMDRRRFYEIRVNSAGHLELFDGETHQKWDRKLEAERDKAEAESRKKEEEQDKIIKKIEKIEKTDAPKKGSGWGWSLRGKSKKAGDEDTDGEDTDVEGDDGDSTSVMLDQEKEGEVTILERRPTLKERLDGLVHTTADGLVTPSTATEASPAGVSKVD